MCPWDRSWNTAAAMTECNGSNLWSSEARTEWKAEMLFWRFISAKEVSSFQFIWTRWTPPRLHVLMLSLLISSERKLVSLTSFPLITLSPSLRLNLQRHLVPGNVSHQMYVGRSRHAVNNRLVMTCSYLIGEPAPDPPSETGCHLCNK